MPVRTRPSPMTKSAAISSTLGSLKPATASWMVSTPLSGSATITSRATTSMRGLLRIKSTMLPTSRARTTARSVFMHSFRADGAVPAMMVVQPERSGQHYHGYTSARNVKPCRVLHVHQEIHQRPRGIAEEGQQADASDVPEEADLLHAHGRDTRGRADDQTAAAGTGTEGQQLPEAAIDNEPTHPLGLGCRGRGEHSFADQRIHLHGAGYQRHVIHHRRQQPDGVVDGEDVAQPVAQRQGDLTEVSGCCQAGDSQQDTQEEQ